MVYVVMIPLGIVGLVQVTRTALVLILTTASMTGGLGAVHKTLYVVTDSILSDLLLVIPDSAVVTLIGGSLVGPRSTVNAKILQLYSVKGSKSPTVPVVLVPSTIYVNTKCS